MKVSLILLGIGFSATVQASWFGSSSESAQPYTAWSASELSSWLEAHNVQVPSNSRTQAELKDLVAQNWNSASAWTYDQYLAAQKTFADIRDASFDKWDESQLREFLLAQGVVAPKGPREQLIQLAKTQYRAYTSAASSFSARASTSVHGDSKHQATQSLSSLATKATDEVYRALDDSKDYIYSTWDDNQLRNYLESKGVQVKDQAEKSRSDLLRMMHDIYAKVTNPVWEAWSDSYLHSWLVERNIIAPTPPSPYSREYLLNKMSQYYYGANDVVYSTWSESQLKEWLVQQGIVKKEAQLKREKALKLVRDNYLSAKSTIFSAWSDSDLRNYLVEHKYIDDRTAAQTKRDDLIKLVQDKYTSATTPSYLTWPDARLRAYLRQHNLSESELPTSRPGLLQETRIRWVQTQNTAEALWAKIKDIVGSVEEGVEERLWNVWSTLRGEVWDIHGYGKEKYADAAEKYELSKNAAGEKYEQGKKQAGDAYEEGKKQAGDKYSAGKDYTQEKYAQAGEKYTAGQEYLGGKYDDAKAQAGRQYSDAEKKYEAGKERAYEKGQEARENIGEKVKVTGQKIKGEL
ncbi:Meiotic sister chromatid recombination protein 1 [Hypsizygus marmoreus]|uniref:Meiotic sister chromatid recombination protein 1 n=1 Tax=Hypsizygus marmoreus TaxID=39966 RepID=A0A369JU37_HYPMA|nr:Meiotic sister chromatid recombination protein 1 [Hypsizygus marmoreus]